MKKVEKFIRDCTKNFSNDIEQNVDGLSYLDYIPWLTPDEARKAAGIAREETIKEVCEWLDNHTILSEKWYIEDLKNYLENKK